MFCYEMIRWRTYLQSQTANIDDMDFAAISAPDCLIANDTHAADRVLWSADAQVVIAVRCPPSTCEYQHANLQRPSKPKASNACLFMFSGNYRVKPDFIKTRTPTNWWGSANRNAIHPRATVIYNACIDLFQKSLRTPTRVECDNNAKITI